MRDLWYDYNCSQAIRLKKNHLYNIDTLLSAVEYVRSTLEYLTISVYFNQFDVDVFDFYTTGPLQGSWSSMEDDWPRLKAVQIPFVMLVGWECDEEAILDVLGRKFSPALQKLGLTDDLGDWSIYQWDRGDIIAIIRYLLETGTMKDLQKMDLRVWTLREEGG